MNLPDAHDKQQNQSGSKHGQRKCQTQVPSVPRMQPCDDSKIHADARTVQKKAQVRTQLLKKDRQEKNPQNRTASDHIQGPVCPLKDQKIQKPADSRCYSQYDADQDHRICLLHR